MLSKKTISILLKIGIVAFALYFLFEQFNSRQSTSFRSLDILDKINSNYITIIVVIFMMFMNWFLEALKWKFLINKIEEISLMTSIRAVFSGITVSTFTPNRIGEYAGRVFCLEKGDRIKAVLITIIGSMSQLFNTIFFGFIGFIFLPNFIVEASQFFIGYKYLYLLFIVIIILLNILLLVLFLNTKYLSILFYKINWLKKYHEYIAVFSLYSKLDLLKILLISFFRYFIFTLQFYILLKLFDVEVTYLNAIVLIMCMLFIVSLIPTIAITEIGVRGSVAIFLFGLISTNTTGIITATFLLWIINLLIPALLGTFFIFTLKFFRK